MPFLLIRSISIISLIFSLSISGSFAWEVGSLSSEIGEEIPTTILPILPWLFPSRGDSSIDTFTTRYAGLYDPSYTPRDLTDISTLQSIDQAWRLWSLRREARDALGNLAEAFSREFGTRLVVISGYRSAASQQLLWDLGRCSEALCATPGYSEHQLGLAIDIFDATTAADYYENIRYRTYIRWMQDYAHLYGWHQSYQNGEYIDAYEVESWHWRYLWVSLATKLKSLDMSYTEYIRLERTLEFWRR